MIIWIASYPKSGNTYIRSFLSAYYYSNNGEFNFNLLKYIEQFPDKQFFEGFINSKEEVSKLWVSTQKKIVSSKKVRFLKTHSAYGSYDNNPFTTPDITLGGIYIIRDPRNVAISLMNHFSLDQSGAIEMLIDENRGIKSADNNFATYAFLSTWANHYKSWSNIKSFKTCLIKYEDLEKNSEKVLINLVKFINNLLNNNQGIDYQKLNRAIETTSFDFLKTKENQDGFKEAMFSKEKDQKVPFFNNGFNTNWKKKLDKNLAEKIEKKFFHEMREVKYL